MLSYLSFAEGRNMSIIYDGTIPHTGNGLILSPEISNSTISGEIPIETSDGVTFYGQEMILKRKDEEIKLIKTMKEMEEQIYKLTETVNNLVDYMKYNPVNGTEYLKTKENFEEKQQKTEK